MDKKKAAGEIIAHALPLVPFEGWSLLALRQAAANAGYKESDVVRVFPGGAIDAVDGFIRLGDEMMLAALKEYNLQGMKIRERIATLVRLRIGAHAAHREAVRKAVAIEAMPLHCWRALGNLYRTVDIIWREAGDTSTDFNFYTKRLMLAGVYSATLLFWLDDKSPGQEETWEFLNRRIDDVMKIEKAKQQLRGWVGKTA